MKQKEGYTSVNKFLFDGCLVCDGMKKADREKRNLTEEELQKLFRRSNKKCGVVSF